MPEQSTVNKAEAASITVPSPFGPLSISEFGRHIVALDWHEAETNNSSPLLEEAKAQMADYFSGKLKNFDLPLAPRGNQFQQDVCREMLKIPYGETCTYGDIAKTLNTYGQPVGNACGGNTIPIIIPCHRVLASSGLGGYSGEGGVERKIALLKHEGGYPYLL